MGFKEYRADEARGVPFILHAAGGRKNRVTPGKMGMHRLEEGLHYREG